MVVARTELRVVHEGSLHGSGRFQGLDKQLEPHLFGDRHFPCGLFRRLSHLHFVHNQNIAYFRLLVNKFSEKQSTEKKRTKRKVLSFNEEYFSLISYTITIRTTTEVGLLFLGFGKTY